MHEIPVAQLTRTLISVNSTDEKKIPKLEDLSFFKDAKDEDGFPPEAAAVAVALLHERKCPKDFIAVWPEIDKAAKKNAKVPSIRALKSECNSVIVLAPTFKDGRVSGVFSVSNSYRGQVKLIDIDRPFYRVDVRVPMGKAHAYIEEMSIEVLSSG